MTKILLNGCNGNMGQTIVQTANTINDVTISTGIDLTDSQKNKFPVYTKLKDCTEPFDVIIDFSHPDALNDVLNYAKKMNKPLVMATTGLTPEHKNLLTEASKTIPLFYSANMSIGINLLIDLVKQAALRLYENFDIEIIEKHHNQKIDSPSGTALDIANSINDSLDQAYRFVFDRHSYRRKRSENEIGIHAVRGGTIAGEHSVIFAGNNEILEINHSAISREVFAVGALKAAIFIQNKKTGFYNMDDMLGINKLEV